MQYLFAILQLIVLAIVFISLIAAALSILKTKMLLRRNAKKIRSMGISRTTLSNEEAEAAKRIFPRYAKRIVAGDSVTSIAGVYGYMSIQSKYGSETRTNHTIGGLPFLYLQSMETALLDNEENTATLLILQDGTVLPISINDSWTVIKEADIQNHLTTNTIGATSSDGWKISQRREPVTLSDYQFYHPRVNVLPSILLFIGSILLLVWDQPTSLYVLYTGSIVTVIALIGIFYPERSTKANIPLLTLSGIAVRKHDMLLIDRFQILLSSLASKKIAALSCIQLEGWIDPKKNTLFYATAIKDTYGESLWSIKANHRSKKWIRYVLPLSLLILTTIMYTGSNASFSIASDYLNWKKNGQIVQEFSTIAELSDRITANTLPPGSIVSLTNFLILEESSSGESYSFKAIQKPLLRQPDLRLARHRAAVLTELLRTPLCTSIYIPNNYREQYLPYISLHIDQFTSEKKPSEFLQYYSDSDTFAAFLQAVEDTDIVDSWNAFLSEEIRRINTIIDEELEESLREQPSIRILSDYNTPQYISILDGQTLTEKDLNPYQIPVTKLIRSPFSKPAVSWIVDKPLYEEKMHNLEQLLLPEYNHTALVTQSRISPDGEAILEATFSLYRIERAQSEEAKLYILVSLFGISLLLFLCMAGSILLNFLTDRVS